MVWASRDLPSSSSGLKCTIQRWACLSTLWMPLCFNSPPDPMNFLLPLTLHGCELPWLPWHEKQSSQPWPSTKMLGAGGKVCLATWHGPFLLPFQEAGVTFAVSYTWEIFHPSLVNLYIQVPTLKVQRTPAKSCHGMGGADLPNAM